MKISDITLDDCKHCAKVLVALKSASFQTTAKELSEYGAGIKWLHDLALNIAKTFEQQANKPKAEDGGSNMGLPSSVQIRSYNPGNLSELKTAKAKKSKKNVK